MELILWRHAEAQDHPYGDEGEQGDALDLERRLTARGEKQAAHHLPSSRRSMVKLRTLRASFADNP